LRLALSKAGLGVAIEEVDTGSSETPEALRGWGSPTILIDGRDVGGEAPAGAGCRLYRGEDGEARGAPSAALLQAALERWGHGEPGTQEEARPAPSAQRAAEARQERGVGRREPGRR